ncbi:hypothetical protein BH20ACT16_BH20ACT16_13050 [soil metagenome]
MLKRSRTMVSLVAAGALLAVPAAGLAKENGNKGKGKAHATKCAKAHKASFVVHGTLVIDATTPFSEATVTLLVTSANSHARKSGDIPDMDAAKKGVQVKGATLTIAAGDAYTLTLKGYEGTDTPSAGDRVKVQGRTPLTKSNCAEPGTSTADRYGTTDVKKVKISHRDADA